MERWFKATVSRELLEDGVAFREWVARSVQKDAERFGVKYEEPLRAEWMEASKDQPDFLTVTVSYNIPTL